MLLSGDDNEDEREEVIDGREGEDEVDNGHTGKSIFLPLTFICICNHFIQLIQGKWPLFFF